MWQIQILLISFDGIIDKFAATKARKISLWSWIITSAALHRSTSFIFC